MKNSELIPCLNGEKSESFSSLVRNKTGMITLSTVIWKTWPRHSDNDKNKNIKVIQIGKEEVKLSLSADDMIFYIENSTKNC